MLSTDIEPREARVKYMLLMMGTKSDMASTMSTLTTEEMMAHVRFMHEVNERLRETGEFVDGRGLTDPAEARVVRAAPDGSALVTDGPFPEAKEFLAGYWVLECASPDRAYEIAARISTAPGKDGVPLNFPIEVRPVGSAPTG